MHNSIIYNRLEAANAWHLSTKFVSHIVPDEAAKFRHPGLNLPREIRLQVVGDGIFLAYGRGRVSQNTYELSFEAKYFS